ncbi:rRNA methyltransferase 3, mitochondrial isoform X2 [Zerene cesonia]|nr:rRNA methyltransferase 3, mitochondrial isoform X2 [Zerene cesonia]
MTRNGRRILKRASIPTEAVPVKFKVKKPQLDIDILSDPSQPRPLTPRRKKLIVQCSKLRESIRKKQTTIRNLRSQTKRLRGKYDKAEAIVVELLRHPYLQDQLTHKYIEKKTTMFSIRSVRLYSRWMHRRPAKVIIPFEQDFNNQLKKEKVIDLEPVLVEKELKKKLDKDTEINVNRKESHKIQENIAFKNLKPIVPNDIVEKRETKIKKRNFYLSQKKVYDDNGEILFEKLKENDGRISSLLVKLKSKKERMRTNQMLVEGWRLIVDGLEAKCKLKYIIFSQIQDLHNLHPFLPNVGVQIYKVPYKEISKWSDLETPPGIFGVFEMPTVENIKRLSKPLPMVFICDNIRVPGNLGAILRVAVGAGCESVLLTKGCVDVWDPKVVRSAAGAHFRQPIYTSLDWEEIPNHLVSDSSLFIADSNVTTDYTETTDLTSNSLLSQIPVLPYYGVEFSNLKHITLVIGGETEGISEESYRLATSTNGLRLNIPLQRGVDSLNTGMAAAVIAFEIRKQFLQVWRKEKLEREKGQIT